MDIRNNSNQGRRSHAARTAISLAIGLTLALSNSAHAADEAAHDLHIPAQRTDKALLQLAQDAGAQIVFARGLGEHSMSAPVEGRLTVTEALQKLLKDTSLVYEYSPDGVIVVESQEKRRSSQSLAVQTPIRLAQAESPPARTRSESSLARTDLEEVVVTAQKRAESLQDVPLAITAVSGESFENAGVATLDNLDQFASSVTYGGGTEARNRSLRIRGVGTEVFATGVEPSVSTVVDGVVYARPGAAFGDLVDIERIEVLRGPQGMLFGKNASAGAISIVTARPNFQEFEGSASAMYAEDNEYRSSLTLSGPLSDKLAYRVSGFYRKQDGVVENIFDNSTMGDTDAYGVRGKLEWQVTDSINTLLILDTSKDDGTCCGLPLRQASTNPKALPTGTPVGPDNDIVNNDTATPATTDVWGASLETNIDLGGYTVTHIGAYRKFDFDNDRDNDNTQAALLATSGGELSKAHSEELRLASPTGGTIDYVIGLFYYDHDVDQTFTQSGYRIANVTRINPDGSIVAPANQYRSGTSVSSVVTENEAIFGQLNVHPTANLTLLGGLRYVRESIDFDFVRTVATPLGMTPNNRGPLGPLNVKDDDSELMGKAGVQYSFTPAMNGYATYSTGYKGQAVSSAFGLQPTEVASQPLAPEKSKSYEIGLKTQLFRIATINVAAFSTDFEDYQAQARDPVSGGFQLTTAGGVSVDGVEIDFAARPDPYLSLSGGVTYLDAVFEDFRGAQCYVGQTPAQGCVGGVQDVSGKPFPNAPKWRYTASARYDRPFGNGSHAWFVQGDYRWQDEVTFSISQEPYSVQDAYGVANLSIGLSGNDQRWVVEAFCKNLTDQQYVTNIFTVPDFVGAGVTHAVPRDFHRYFGGSVRLRF